MTEREEKRAFPGPSVSDVPEEHRSKGMKGGACTTCRGECVIHERVDWLRPGYLGGDDFGWLTRLCPACHGTGRKESGDE